MQLPWRYLVTSTPCKQRCDGYEPVDGFLFNGSLHGFQSYPLAMAPPIIEQLLAAVPMEELYIETTLQLSFRNSQRDYTGPCENILIDSELSE